MTAFDISIAQIGEILLRVVIVYAVVLAGMRVLGKREIAQLSIVDFVLVLLISNAVQNAMLGEDTSLLGGIVAAAALFGINFVIRMASFRNKRISRLFEGEAVPLVYKGEKNEANMRKAQITDQELMAIIREHGVTDISLVDLAMLEINGNISVLSHGFTKHSEKKLRQGV
jgi:uncharacterized membrane protein YcaP (DUF421 family)